MVAISFTLDGDYVGELSGPYGEIHYPGKATQMAYKENSGYVTLETSLVNSKVDIIRYVNLKGQRHRWRGPAVDTGHVKMWYLYDKHRPDIGRYVKEAEMEVPLNDENLSMIMLAFS